MPYHSSSDEEMNTASSVSATTSTRGGRRPVGGRLRRRRGDVDEDSSGEDDNNNNNINIEGDIARIQKKKKKAPPAHAPASNEDAEDDVEIIDCDDDNIHDEMSQSPSQQDQSQDQSQDQPQSPGTTTAATQGRNVILDDPDSDTLRILLSTDNHLGYAENDNVRGNDSFAALEEVLFLAKEYRADMVLLAGDLFHENRPSRRTLYKTSELNWVELSWVKLNCVQ